MDDFDPVRAPLPTATVADALKRSRVVLSGMVLATEVTELDNGPLVEVSVSDGTATVVATFFGRRTVAGLAPGSMVTLAGVLGTRSGRPALVNPWYWLTGTQGGAHDA